ncbi:MAG TPA: serine/threonine-protein kinase [Thermoanaerobaculia bacterium]|nr:serine/threonine-protein kinase [Thermoanaerobaculia bacterium]
MAERPPSDRWQELKELFEEAIESPAGQRETILARAARLDGSLAGELKTLLEAHDHEGQFLEDIVGAEGRDLVAISRDGALLGRRVGSYELLGEIGTGGMGTVFLARRTDSEYESRVAVKLIRPGVLSEEALRRFRAERQALANLNHAGIARLLDGGTTSDGLPFLVMEYIEGEPIDKSCDRRNLSIEGRLALFRSVCEAVEHAHRHMVIHRDIKPGNILVTASGDVKLLDFGIAKLLPGAEWAEPAGLTRTAHRVMTPDYASPEQILGQRVAASSDVYSLGVLLYRLLTGKAPYTFTSERASEIERTVCEQEPVKPSAAVEDPARRKRLRGDLDDIVMQALRKEPERRYGSVEQLSGDIRRHLEGLPVRARPGTLSYRAGKFLRRHHIAVAAAAVILLVLLSGLAATIWEARIAMAERARAEERFDDVRRLATSFLFEFHDAVQDLPGSTPARKLVVARALQYLDRLSKEAGGDASLKRDLASAYQRIGDVQGNPNNANLGDSASALKSYRKALSIAEPLVAADPSDAQARRTVGVIYEKMADVLAWSGSIGAGVSAARRSLGFFEGLAREAPRDAGKQRSLAISHIKVGDISGNPSFPNDGNPREALRQYRFSAAILEDLSKRDPADPKTRRFLGIVHERLGTVSNELGDTAGALEAYRRSFAIREAVVADQPNNTDARRDAAIASEKIGDVLKVIGDRKGALEGYSKALAGFESLAAADPDNANATRSLSIIQVKMGEALAGDGRPDEALAIYKKALSIREKLAAADPASVQARRDLLDSLVGLARFTAATHPSESRDYETRARALEKEVDRR